MVIKAHRKDENFGNPDNKVDVSVPNSWTRFSCIEDDDRIVEVQAVYWNCSSGTLQIRDAYGDVIYNDSRISGAMAEPEIFPTYITVRLPLEYYTGYSSGSIRIWGKFV